MLNLDADVKKRLRVTNVKTASRVAVLRHLSTSRWDVAVLSLAAPTALFQGTSRDAVSVNPDLTLPQFSPKQAPQKETTRGAGPRVVTRHRALSFLPFTFSWPDCV